MKLILLLSLTVVFVATGAEGLRCYECGRPGGRHPDDCDDIGESSVDCRLFSTILRSHSSNLGYSYDACFTNKQDGKIVKMGCHNKGFEENCGDDNGSGDEYCTCTTDLCNAAVRPGMTPATSALILFAAVAKYIFA